MGRFLINVLAMIALAAFVVLIVVEGQTLAEADGIIFVDIDAAGANNGTSWEDAFTSLQPALEAAAEGDQIWVAEGVYKPTRESTPNDPRSATFQLKNDVALFGGFDPSEGDIVWEDRDWAGNMTVLSGDIDNNDITDPAGVVTNTVNITGTNSYHVFFHPDGTTLNSSAILDGFTISGGNADGNYNGDASIFQGGGMFNVSSSPTLDNCTFSGNSALISGGGMQNISSSPALNNCTFTGNSALQGGGMLNESSSLPTLNNCTFMGNSAGFGGGMGNYFYSSPTLINCIFTDNTAGNGGGMYNSHYSSPTLTNCTYTGNSAQNLSGGMMSLGGGMINIHHSSPTLTSCTFTDNSAANGGGGMYNDGYSSPMLTSCIFANNSVDNDYGEGGGMHNYGSSSPTLTNCTFKSNSADRGGGMNNSLYSSPTLINCIFVGNSADWGGGILNHLSTPTLTNAILWGNSSGQIDGEYSTPIITYSDIQGGCPSDAACTQVINVDPLFVDSANGDFHLERGSLCIDAGNNVTPYLPLYDFEGDPRILDGNGDGTATTDIGVDEWFFSIFVDADATGANDGSNWEDAFTSLQSALATAVEGDQIWVAEGVYNPTWEFSPGNPRSAAFQLKNGVALYGGFDPSVSDISWEDRDWAGNVTVLSGDIDNNDITDPAGVVTSTANITGTNSYHVFYHPDVIALDSSAILDGFTITAGNANEEYPYYFGGGMYNYGSSPTLTNCTFSGNSAHNGGGMVDEAFSSPTLTNCSFSGNSAYFGGGMYNLASSPTLTNCTFEGNSADYHGGGMLNLDSSSPTLTNCTFTSNSAPGGSGGGMSNSYSSSPTLTNCTFSGNSASYGGGMGNTSSSPKLTNCIFTGNSAQLGGGILIENSISPTLINCTFSGNSAHNGGGIFNYNSSPTLTNAILWSNTPEQLDGENSTPVITFSDIQGGCPSNADCTQVINADPLFINPAYGDFRLEKSSPCIDAGNNAAVPASITTDLLGLPRFVDILYMSDSGSGTPPIVDIGAYEAQFVGFIIDLPIILK